MTTLRRGKAAYVPNVELGVHPVVKERFLGRPLTDLRDEVEFARRAGYDYVKLQPVADFNPDQVGVEQKTQFYQDGTVKRTWASEGSGVITTAADFERYRFPKKEDFEYSKFEQIRDLLPDGMGVIGQYGDIFTMTWEMMGFETFSRCLFEEPELVDALNEKLGNLVISMFEYFAQSDAVDVLWYSDDIAYTGGLLVSPKTLDRYFFPWLRKIGELARKHDKPLMYHSDGILYKVMDTIIDCGVDALHPIEPKSMDIVEVKQRYGNRLCLLGNLDVDLLSRGKPEDVREQVRQNIERVGYNGGYCVGSGNSIPEYVNYENYLAMLAAVREFGGG
jgi:uroporphyrinogen decarboxylase